MSVELKVGGVLYRRNGEPVEIVRETKQSWIVGPAYSEIKISKKALREKKDHWPQHFIDRQDALDTHFVDVHHYRIGTAVQQCKDGQLLRKIAQMVGYSEGRS